ncbi:MAG: 50S ribosomal protein L3 [Verrucomicrobia bacterium]|nr:50S ribosomal protein L3 [Verrucomicrobiota bacterium]
MGRKRGMTQLFDDKGNIVTCTVIHAEPNVITQIKTRSTDGYEAIQLAYDEIVVNDPRTIENRVTKPLIGHFRKAQVAPSRFLYETRVDNAEEYQVGQKLDVTLFKEVGYVDATGTSKGKGYQGVMKRHGFSGGAASHGSGHHRHAGSTGMRSTPGRCLPGGSFPGHMGDEKVTVQNLKVVAIDEANNLIIVEGAVPGARNAVVLLSTAIKKQNQAKKKKK